MYWNIDWYDWIFLSGFVCAVSLEVRCGLALQTDLEEMAKKQWMRILKMGAVCLACVGISWLVTWIIR